MKDAQNFNSTTTLRSDVSLRSAQYYTTSYESKNCYTVCKAEGASPSKTEKAKGATFPKSKKAKGELPPMTENENPTKKISDLVHR